MVEHVFEGVVLKKISDFCKAFATRFGIKLMKTTAAETGIGGYIIQTPEKLIVHFYTPEELEEIEKTEGPRPDLVAPTTIPTRAEIEAFLTAHIK